MQRDTETKAQVLADHALGMSKSAIARKYEIPRTTVIAWIKDAGEILPTVTDTQKRDELGVLVYDYLATGLRALIAQVRESGEPTYIRAQPADKLYLLHGTIADKLIAILANIERPDGVDGDTVT